MVSLLAKIEYWGNKIPHPSLMFLMLCLFVIVISALCHVLGLSSVNTLTDESIAVKSLISAEGLRFMLTSMVKNFTGFAPLGIVLVAMLGIGIAEKSELLNQLLLKAVHYAKGKGLTFIVAFTGVMSSLAADSGYVILIPIAALMFKAAGRSPMAGIATAFAAVSGGYSANLLIGPIDAVLSGLSNEAIHLVNPDISISASSNWYFNAFSCFFIALLVTFITEARSWKHSTTADACTPSQPNENDKTYSFKALLPFSVIFMAVVLALVLPEHAPLRHPQTGSISQSPFIQSIVIIIALYFAGTGLIFGFSNNTFTSSKDVITAMEDSMKSLSGYLVMMFFAAQFIAYFNWSNLGLIIALEGADFLKNIELPGLVLLIVFMLISATINLFIGSSSAKWALIAPIFVPMLMLLGVAPEATQLAYRIGDSSTNIITPMMPYFALVLGFAQQHDKEAGLGTLMAAMLPYSLAFLVLWSALFIAWISFDLPLGF